MSFLLEVYYGDDHIGAITLNGRYVHMVVDGERYPFRAVEDACVALLALQNRAALDAKEKEARAKAKAKAKAEG